MPARRLLFSRGITPRVVALLMAMTMVAVGIGLPPIPVDGLALDSEDQSSDSIPCEESSSESAEDEEVSAGKHSPLLAATFRVEGPSGPGLRLVESCSRLSRGLLLGAPLIRGPPVAA